MAYASGRNARSVCERCGFQYPYRDMHEEAGTGVWVCRSCDDRTYNLVGHPQNSPFPISQDPQALEYVSPEIVLQTSVSWTPRDTIYFPTSSEVSVGVTVTVSTSTSTSTFDSGMFDSGLFDSGLFE